MNWQDLFCRFQLKNDLVFNDNIGFESNIQFYRLINNGNTFLSKHSETKFSELVNKYFLIDRFKEPRTEDLMYLDTKIDNDLGMSFSFIIDLVVFAAFASLRETSRVSIT